MKLGTFENHNMMKLLTLILINQDGTIIRIQGEEENTAIVSRLKHRNLFFFSPSLLLTLFFHFHLVGIDREPQGI